MRWIKIPWDNMEVAGLCIYLFGAGVGLGLIFEYHKCINIGFMFVGLCLLISIGLFFTLLGSKKAFDKFKGAKKNERI